MTAISVTGNFRTALYDGKWGGASFVITSTLFDDSGSVFPSEPLPVVANGGGECGFKLTAPGSGTKRYTVVLQDASTFLCDVDASPTSITLSELLANGSPEAGDTVLLTGEVRRPFGGVAWAGGTIRIALDVAFVTTAAVYPREEWTLYLDANGKINGATGVTLACKATTDITYTITLPDGSEHTATVNGTMTSIDLAAIVP